jgi:hypothetical protein
MSAKVSAKFKANFDFCMAHWKSLGDGFTDDDILEAKQVVRQAIQEGRGEICESWFAREAEQIMTQPQFGINERIQASIEAERELEEHRC